MSRKVGNAQSRATFFRHSAVLSLLAVLLVPLDKMVHRHVNVIVIAGKMESLIDT